MTRTDCACCNTDAVQCGAPMQNYCYKVGNQFNMTRTDCTCSNDSAVQCVAPMQNYSYKVGNQFNMIRTDCAPAVLLMQYSAGFQCRTTAIR